ncbi:response regulator transcription factor [Haloarcula salinisoli]|uniref:Response regulator n=1 Tax=Haloarcula salinisoli TaxID=2487746 RepID=A0A8J7YBW2_9EURY|nr:response regulator [Halomicroarcula salinisoli]MBX0285920.1 response regulator [Halomicroarcula salinisoli]MBX0302587.1 response regulator [Halomicroarcula salinisoli]
MNETLANGEGSSPDAPHIVCADDDGDIRQMLEFSLESEGYEVTTCADGAKCWDCLLEMATPDLIVLDVMMPGHGGFELLGKIRESERLADVPVIILTSRTREEDVVTGFDSGANHYVEKPFSPRGLAARIRTVLE